MHELHIVAQPTISGPPSEHIAMPPKRKDEELDLDVHPSLEKEYLERIERAKQTCAGSVNGKQREAFIVRGIDKDITDRSRISEHISVYRNISPYRNILSYIT